MLRIILDPGHGGQDSGAIGPSGLLEKDVNLAIALKVRDLLAPVAEVGMTRATDMALGTDERTDLRRRCEISNQFGAFAFVSIHCNAVDNPDVHGTETYHYPNSYAGRKLATAIHTRLVALGLADRGVKEANFMVLRGTNASAALVEVAFISNPEEEQLLASPDFQERAARAIAEGIAEFLGVQLPASPEEKKFFPHAPASGSAGGTGRDSMPDDWKLAIVEKALEEGLITQQHDPDDPAPKWFVLATELNLLKRIMEALGKEVAS